MNKMKTYKVSVLIPAFNEEKYILTTLQALLKQDYLNFEVIIVNNLSTDNTRKVVEDFINDHPHLQNMTIVDENLQGTNHARERGRKIATGDIIAQLDADCIPASNWISRGVKLMQKSNIVAVTGPYDYFDTFFFRRYITLLAQIIFYPVVDTFSQLFKKGGIIIGGNTFIDATVLEKAGGYNTSFTFYGDDIDIAKKVFSYGRIFYSNQLILKSSSRRFKALGFNTVQKKYRKAFIDLIFLKGMKIEESIELIHPR